jgi:hypothetical protein
MAAQINDTLAAQLIDGVQEGIIAKGRVPSGDTQGQVRVKDA